MHTFIVLLSVGTVFLNIVLVLGLLCLLNREWRRRAIMLIQSNTLLLVFVLSVSSIAGTLLMQYVGLLNPCVLCWWQRIFMYPIAVISGIALLKTAPVTDIADYVLAFSIPGAGVALYQHLLQTLPSGTLIPCDASGDCAVRSVFEFGYITVPWMAFSVFAVFIFVALVARKRFQ